MHHAPDPAIGGDEACNVTCNGNESQNCGGVGVMSVFGQNQDSSTLSGIDLPAL